MSRSEHNLASSVASDSGNLHSRSPSVGRQPSGVTAAEQELLQVNPLTTVLSDDELLKFVCKPVPANIIMQCTIVRDKKGLDRSLYPTYYMHLQGECDMSH